MIAGVTIFSLEQHFWKRITRPKEPRHRDLTEESRIQNAMLNGLPLPGIHQKYNPNKTKYRYLDEDDRTIEEIIYGKTLDEIYEELSAKDHKDLTENESLII